MRLKLFEGTPAAVESEFNAWQEERSPRAVIGFTTIGPVTPDLLRLVAQWVVPKPEEPWARFNIELIIGAPSDVIVAVDDWLQRPTDASVQLSTTTLATNERDRCVYACIARKFEQPKVIVPRNGDTLVH